MEGYKSRFGVGQLELALGKLYTDPLVIYREYIQNACDGLQLALESGLIQQNEAVISIEISKNEISIKDRGVGVSSYQIGPRLVDLGNSTKYKDNLIGQYGIGRLIAAQYCEKIIFETSYQGENKRSILTWDTEEAFRMIDSHEVEDATDVVNQVTHLELQDEEIEEHYFRVRLLGLKKRFDELINVDSVINYVSQIAPIDYSMEFKEDYLLPALETNLDFKKLYNQERIYKVIINGEDVRKPYTKVVPGKDTNLTQPLFLKIEDIDDGMLAWGWYALNDRIIQMNNISFRGIRFRKLNTAVGDANVMSNFMKNVSVNYFVGEIFFIHENIQPTGSRDGFVDSDQYSDFKILMREQADKLYSLYDKASHLGSQAVDKITSAYLRKSELSSKLASESDPEDKKEIREQIRVQEQIISTKSDELQDRLTAMEATEEGKIIAESVLQSRQSSFEKKVEDKNRKNKSGKSIKRTTITKIVESNNNGETVPATPDTPTDPRAKLLMKLSKEQKATYNKICEVIEQEPTLTPTYIENLKFKILKRLAK